MLVQDIQSINICTEELTIFSFLFLLSAMKYFSKMSAPSFKENALGPQT